MSLRDKKPLVLGDDARMQQLQRTDDLDIPLQQRHEALEARFNLLVECLIAEGFNLPNELLTK